MTSRALQLLALPFAPGRVTKRQQWEHQHQEGTRLHQAHSSALLLSNTEAKILRQRDATTMIAMMAWMRVALGIFKNPTSRQRKGSA